MPRITLDTIITPDMTDADKEEIIAVVNADIDRVSNIATQNVISETLIVNEALFAEAITLAGSNTSGACITGIPIMIIKRD